MKTYKLWSIYDLEPFEDDEERFKLRGSEKLFFGVTNDNNQFVKIVVGDEYWFLERIGYYYVKCIITGLRTGVVFYKREDKQDEEFFHETSFDHMFLEPVNLTVNLPSKYYEIGSRSGLINVKYSDGVESKSTAKIFNPPQRS